MATTQSMQPMAAIILYPVWVSDIRPARTDPETGRTWPRSAQVQWLGGQARIPIADSIEEGTGRATITHITTQQVARQGREKGDVWTQTAWRPGPDSKLGELT